MAGKTCIVHTEFHVEAAFGTRVIPGRNQGDMWLDLSLSIADSTGWPIPLSHTGEESWGVSHVTLLQKYCVKRVTVETRSITSSRSKKRCVIAVT